MAAQWQRERPDLDVASLLVFGRIRYASGRLDALMRPVLAEAGIGRGEFDILAFLRLAGLPYALTFRQLCDRAQVTAGSVTNRVDRLVAGGHVVKTVALGDGRGRVVQLTDSGLHLVDRVMAEHLAIGQELLTSFTAAEADSLAAELTRIGRAIDDRVEPPQG